MPLSIGLRRRKGRKRSPPSKSRTSNYSFRITRSRTDERSSIANCGVPFFAAILVAVSLAFPSPVAAEPIRLGATTTVRDSGFLEYLLERYRAETGNIVIPIVASTGLILSQASRGDFDVTLTHDPVAETNFIEAGHSIFDAIVMANDFVLVGPIEDPAAIRKSIDRADAFRRIADHAALFISRGDDSGTHRRELSIWQQAGMDPSVARVSWYIESGTGMGTTLNIAAQRQAYTLTDRATWLAYRGRDELDLLVESAELRDNHYRVIVIDSTLHPEVDQAAAMAFAAWLTSRETKELINAYRIDGEQVYFAIE